MIFAAGLGTRLRPLTDRMPKALVPVAGKPLLWHVAMRLKTAGVERIVINVHHFAEQIIQYVAANGSFGLDVRISDERQQLLETGGGIRHARQLLDATRPVLIHNVDILSNADLDMLYRQQAEAVLLVSSRQTKRYLLFGPDMCLCGWTNIETGQVKPASLPRRSQDDRPLHLAFSGIHLLSPALLPLMDRWPQRFSIIDFYLDLCSGHRLQGIVQPGLQLLDVGKQDTLQEAEQFVEKLRAENGELRVT
ncbi:MAG: nucleotidyltransferase family protein [Prevotella sp.]|nr:nucleotidyltransferase family protein [Prevotella sp.]